jgi:hypothetical protein
MLKADLDPPATTTRGLAKAVKNCRLVGRRASAVNTVLVFPEIESCCDYKEFQVSSFKFQVSSFKAKQAYYYDQSPNKSAVENLYAAEFKLFIIRSGEFNY